MLKFAAMVLTILLTLTAADAQVQSVAQRKCISGADKATAKIVSIQWKAARKCLSKAASGELLTGQTTTQCLLADNDAAIAKAVAKAGASETKLCSEQAPDFGHAAAATRSAAAIAAALDGFEDLFSDDLDSAVITTDANKPAAKCQSNAAKVSGKALSAMLGEFLACKAAGLKDGSIAAAADLDRCFTAIDSDAKGKIAKAGAGMNAALEPSECGTALFPSACAMASDFGACVITADRCRICEVLVSANQLTRDCDQFDDSLLNLSCEPINSCLTDNGGCDDNATCTSTGPGTNSCACNSGYSGDGTSCEPINSCLTNNGSCDTHATCTSTGPSTNSCACNSGYSGDGITCAVACIPVLDPPTLNGGYVTLKRTRTTTGAVSLVNITQPSVPSAQTIDDQRFTNEFNASAFIDPAACDGEPLQFRWFLSTISVPGDYQVAGITGYDSSVLTVAPNSLIGGNTIYTLRLVVTSTASPNMPVRSTTYPIQVSVASSQADLAAFNACQDGSPATPCTISNLLPPGVEAE